MKNSLNLLSPRLVGLALAGTLATYAHATVFTFSIITAHAEGTYDGLTGSGTVTYDESLLSGIDRETLEGNGDFDLTMTLLGQTFTDEDDINFPDYPELYFMDGMPIELDYIISEVSEPIDGEGSPSNPVEIDALGVFDISLYELNPTPGEAHDFAVIVFINDALAPIPEPSSAGLLGILGLGIALARRQRR